jgi:hypothetical protein
MLITSSAMDKLLTIDLMIMLCLVEESIGIVDVLSGALQLHAQDILNDLQPVLSAIQLVFTSK